MSLHRRGTNTRVLTRESKPAHLESGVVMFSSGVVNLIPIGITFATVEITLTSPSP